MHLAMASTVEAQTAEEAKVCPRLSRVTGSPADASQPESYS